MRILTYGVATMSGLLKMICLFCRISSLLQGSFAKKTSLLKGSFEKETYNFKKPTDRSHHIGFKSSVGIPFCDKRKGFRGSKEVILCQKDIQISSMRILT